MNIDPDKYIVVKAEDLAFVLQRMVGDDRALIPNDLQRHQKMAEWKQAIQQAMLDDAVVIRHHDVFAPSALYAYATAVLTAIEIIRDNGTATEALDHLEDLADYFSSQADTARQVQSKLPD